jgi:hypothetical protein
MRRQEVSHLVFPGAKTLNPTYIYIYMSLNPFREFTNRVFGTGEHKKLTVRYPGCRNTDTPNTIRAKPFRHFSFQDFALCESALCHIGTFPIGVLHLVDTRNKNYPLGISGTETPKHPRLNVLSHFQHLAYQDFRAWHIQGKLTLGLSGSETSKRESKSHYAISRFRKSRLHDTRGRRFTPFDFPSTEKPILPLVIHSTKNPGFHGSEIRNMHRQEISHLSLPRVNGHRQEVRRHQLLIYASISRFHPSEFCAS